MKKLAFIFTIAILTSTFTSCGTTASIQKNDAEIAGYTLKSKTQLMEQKILNKQSKKVIVQP